jgi:hypothetical protein
MELRDYSVPRYVLPNIFILVFMIIIVGSADNILEGSGKTAQLGPYLPMRYSTNPLVWLGYLLIGFTTVYLIWNAARNYVLYGYKYTCLNCNYSWIQLKPSLRVMTHNFKRAERDLRWAKKNGITTDQVVTLQRLAIYTAYFTGDWQKAVALMQESVKLAETAKDTRLQAICYGTLSALLLVADQAAQAVPIVEQGLILATTESLWDVYGLLTNTLGVALARQGSYELAQQYLKKGLVYNLKMGSIEIELPINSLEGLAEVALGYNSPGRAVYLAGAANARRTALNTPLSKLGQAHFDQMLEKARTKLGPSNFEKAWAEGLTMPLVPAVQYALSDQT